MSINSNPFCLDYNLDLLILKTILGIIVSKILADNITYMSVCVNLSVYFLPTKRRVFWGQEYLWP